MSRGRAGAEPRTTLHVAGIDDVEDEAAETLDAAGAHRASDLALP